MFGQQDLFSVFNSGTKKDPRNKARQFEIHEEHKNLEAPVTKKLHTETPNNTNA